MEIRKIRKGERDRALDIMREAFDPSYESIFFLNEDWCLVAEEDGKILAGTNSDIFTLPNGKKIGYIGWLYTSSKARGRGLASKLTSAMIDFLEKEGCDEILAIVEGDNPSSFKLFSEQMEIMSLPSQLRSFGSGIFKVWKRSSHFFDTGYFVWHKGKGLKLEETHWKSFALNMLLNALLLALFFGIRGKSSLLTILIPIAFLAIRALILRITMGYKDTIFLPWDTYPAFSLISALVLPFYIPTLLGVYIKGRRWNMRDNADRLSRAATATVIFEMLALIVTQDLTVILPVLIADSFLSFYPFCGFQASRMKRKGGRLPIVIRISSIAAILAALAIRFVL